MSTADVTAADARCAPTLIGSVQRALRLLEAVASRPCGAPAKQLAREAGLPLPTVYHLLRTLAHEGYLRREEGVYVLGDAAQRLGGDGRRQRGREAIRETLAEIGGELDVAVYFSVYREGEIDVLTVAAGPTTPAVEEWADFRRTAHAHAVGQCLLAQLDETDREDHLARHPVQALTPFSVRSAEELRPRLRAWRRGQPVYERQEYARGTACGALPVSVGATPATLAISVPSHQAIRLRPAVESLRSRVSHVISSLSFSISI